MRLRRSRRRRGLAACGRQWALAASVLLAVGRGVRAVGRACRGTRLPRTWWRTSSASRCRHPIVRCRGRRWLACCRARISRIDPAISEVLFAQTCFFRGRLVPHFVVRSGNAAVTVMVLPNEPLQAPEHFSEQRLRRRSVSGCGPRQHRRAEPHEHRFREAGAGNSQRAAFADAGLKRSLRRAAAARAVSSCVDAAPIATASARSAN